MSPSWAIKNVKVIQRVYFYKIKAWLTFWFSHVFWNNLIHHFSRRKYHATPLHPSNRTTVFLWGEYALCLLYLFIQTTNTKRWKKEVKRLSNNNKRKIWMHWRYLNPSDLLFTSVPAKGRKGLGIVHIHKVFLRRLYRFKTSACHLNHYNPSEFI